MINWVFLYLIIGMWLVFTAILFVSYRWIKAAYLKRVNAAAYDSYSDRPAPKIIQLLYLLVFILCLIFVIKVDIGPIWARMIVAPPLVALVKIRKKPEHDIFIILLIFTLWLGSLFTYMLIGFPPKSPKLQIGNTTITAGHTSYQEIEDSGLILKYVENPYLNGVKEEKFYDIYTRGNHKIMRVAFVAKSGKVTNKSPVKEIYIDKDHFKNIKDENLVMKFDEINLLESVSQKWLDSLSNRGASILSANPTVDSKVGEYNLSYNGKPKTGFWSHQNVNIQTDENGNIEILRIIATFS
ncbi:hypothetical protein [Bulleidia sp. zg-1006]|uniref:hypothetical protein n=1 Tax=Bulleidia sp. zg-1006 TaxID=2806552 RepID=UPI00193A857E|nr:hypothetical protein [Bulleidia sp. zg-1006]QRG87361.1 hypothetical protein JOS54_03375 [Bulleidia sp. zg-1006]